MCRVERVIRFFKMVHMSVLKPRRLLDIIRRNCGVLDRLNPILRSVWVCPTLNGACVLAMPFRTHIFKLLIRDICR